MIQLGIKMLQKENIPSTIGVYLFTQKGKILYVGKAANLKARIKSHFENAKTDRKETQIIDKSDNIEFIETDSEFKALLLESSLIHIHHPRYNVRWRDNKSYLYVKITAWDKYPKIFLTRNENDGKSKYFGPFQSVRAIEEIINEIRKVFPFCMQKKLSKHPCFYSKIGLCNPCPNEIESRIKNLEFRMNERKRYKKNIRHVIKILQGKTDSVLRVLRLNLEQLKKKQEYEKAIILRDKISRFEKLINQTRSVGDMNSQYNLSKKSIDDLGKLLKIYYPSIKNLHRIECYDISSLSQKEATASMVVFIDGQAVKNLYRKFKIKNLKLRSDFEMLDEVVGRRFKNKWAKPDIIVIDGGKPQVRAVRQALSQIENNSKIIGIAKNPDRLIIGEGDLTTVRPPINNLGFNLIKQIRDESHRFARRYHLYLRKKRIFN